MNLSSLADWLRTRITEPDRGASYIEYALILALVAIFAIVAVTFLGESVVNNYSRTNSRI